MHVLSLSRRILDRTCKQEEFMGRGAKRGLVKDDGVAVIGVAGLLPSRQVPRDECSEFSFGKRLRGIRGKGLGHERRKYFEGRTFALF